ncbi:MAG: RHS repeat protein [Gammaproteobacteria bacterium]|nr:RHS repeat protein [Gammaproteobacteria bacterium]
MNEFEQKRLWSARQNARYLSIFWIFAINMMLMSSAVNSAVASRGAAVGGSYAVPATYQQPVYGAHKETVEDMRVKVMGGYVTVTRSWERGKWYINGRWQALQIAACRVDAGVPCAIFRGGTKYERIAQTNVYQHEQSPRETITQTDTGYRWQDRDGNWIIYTGNRFTAYGDRNTVTVSMQYDDSGKLTGVFDHFNNQIIWYEYNAANRVSAIRDYSERRVEYQYDSNGRFTTVTDVRGNTLSYTYAGVNLRTKTDQEGRVTTISYGANGVVTSILDQDDVGDTYTYNYDKNKKEFYKQIRSSGGVITEEWYDRKGDLVKRAVGGMTVLTIQKDGRNKIVFDSVGNKTREEYDAWENLTKIIYADNSTVTKTYDTSNSNVLREVDELGVINEYEYNANGNLVRKLEAVDLPEQRVTTYTYDVYGNRLGRIHVGDAITDEVTISATYDSMGNMMTRTEGEGNTWRYAYDVTGNVLVKTTPLDDAWVFTYDPDGNLLSESNPQNEIIRYSYDGVGNLTLHTDPRNYKTSYQYDNQDNLVIITDPLGGTFNLEYDNDSRPVSMVDEENKTLVSYVYDSKSRIVQLKDGSGNELKVEYLETAAGDTELISRVIDSSLIKNLEYDSRNRVVRETKVVSENTSYVTSFKYDPKGQVTSIVDPSGLERTISYNAFGKEVSLVDRLAGKTIIAYDSRDNRISLTNATGNVYKFEYDRNNNLTLDSRPSGNSLSYVYDAAGRIYSEVDAGNYKTVYLYDRSDRIAGFSVYATASDAVPQKIVSFSYDASSNITGYDDGVTSGSYTYDANNRKEQASVNYGTFTKSVAKTFYSNSRKKTITFPDDSTVRYTYDDGNQFKSLQIPGAGTITVNKYLLDMPLEILYPGGSKREIQYDGLLRPIQITATDPAENIFMQHQYDFNEAGNITKKQTKQGLYAYLYDKENRLLSVDNPGFDDEAYSYDAMGNRLSDSRNGSSWIYNADNQLTSIEGLETFTYTSAGGVSRRTAGGQTSTISYNSERRMASVVNTNGNANYYYDPFGQRLWKEINGQRTYYFYTEEGLSAEFDNTGAVVKLYGYKPDSLWTSDPLFQKSSGQYYYYQNDVIGTPQKLINSSGSTVWSADYYSFGLASVSATSTVQNNLRFPGQYFDQETRSHYNWNRHYDPSTGRYFTIDPLGLNGGVNTYLYAKANPVTYIDDTGLFVVNGIGAAIGAACGALNTPGNRLCGAVAGAISGALGPLAGAIAGVAGGQACLPPNSDCATRAGNAAGNAAASAASNVAGNSNNNNADNLRNRANRASRNQRYNVRNRVALQRHYNRQAARAARRGARAGGAAGCIVGFLAGLF